MSIIPLLDVVKMDGNLYLIGKEAYLKQRDPVSVRVCISKTMWTVIEEDI